MGLFGRLWRRRANEGGERGKKEAALSCPHTALAPHWDRAGDIGDESKATSFNCGVCGESFTHEEAERLRAEDAERRGDTRRVDRSLGAVMNDEPPMLLKVLRWRAWTTEHRRPQAAGGESRRDGVAEGAQLSASE